MPREKRMGNDQQRLIRLQSHVHQLQERSPPHGREFSPTNELETSSRLNSPTRSLRSSAATTLSIPSSINNDSNAGRESGIVDVGTDRFARCMPIPSLGCATYQREERQCCSGRNTGLAQAHHKPRWHEAPSPNKAGVGVKWSHPGSGYWEWGAKRA